MKTPLLKGKLHTPSPRFRLWQCLPKPRRPGAWWAWGINIPCKDAHIHAEIGRGSHKDISDRKTAEDALTQERHLLHTLMNHLPDAIYFKDTAGRFTHVNQALAHLLGVDDPAQVVGKTHFDFFCPEAAERTVAEDEEIMRTGQPIMDRDEPSTWPDGRDGWLSTTKLPFRDRDGTIIGVFGVSRITPRKRAQAARLS